MPTESKLTNKKFAEMDLLFRACCAWVQLPPTSRQASKFRRGLGRAYLVKASVAHDISKVEE